MTLTYQQIHNNYQSIASDRSAVNWLNNGGFTSYDKKLVLIKNTCADRLNAPAVTRDVFDLVDPELYSRGFYSYAVPKTPGQQFLGYWEVSGISGSLTINPSDDSGNMLTSYDGGNFLLVSGSETGSIILDQKIEYYQPLAGQQVTIAVSGRKMSGPVKAEFSLLDGDIIDTMTINAQFFGKYRRFYHTVDLKPDLKSLTFRIKLTGSGTWSLGLSGVALTMGSNSFTTYTPSVADVTIPRNTVFMFTGDSCPTGFVAVADQRMAVVRGGPSYHISGDALQTEFGQDEHDHVEGDDQQPDTLFPPSDLRTATATEMPPDASRWVHSVPYRNEVVWGNNGQDTFPDEDATAALGPTHGHTLITKMNSIPPTFKVLFCEKL